MCGCSKFQRISFVFTFLWGLPILLCLMNYRLLWFEIVHARAKKPHVLRPIFVIVVVYLKWTQLILQKNTSVCPRHTEVHLVSATATGPSESTQKRECLIGRIIWGRKDSSSMQVVENEASLPGTYVKYKRGNRRKRERLARRAALQANFFAVLFLADHSSVLYFTLFAPFTCSAFTCCIYCKT